MRISFDLDDTLICYAPDVPRQEPLAWRTWPLVRDEPLRAHTRQLIGKLRQLGCEIWIYTTSHRHPQRVKLWFALHGIPIDRVINQKVHVRRMQGIKSPPSKNPGAFGISLHVDDSPGVVEEGIRHGFEVILIAPNDPGWDEVVLARVREALKSRPLTGS